MTRITLAALLALAPPLPALAESPAATLTKSECSACHIAYPAGFLPKRSWQAIMGNLSDHFGEDASLAEADRAAIETYLVANAADRDGRNPRWLRAIPNDVIPMRISELSWFTHEHGSRMQARAKADPTIASMSNCVACHRGADRGIFED
jgi:cytochrome c551/c552